MAFRVQLASYDDMKECARVETEAMGTYIYLEDAWHYFNAQKGGLVTVYNEEDHMIGIGRFTVLYDGSGWLETLRISPEWQGQGAGKMIYKEYQRLRTFEQLVRFWKHSELWCL